MSWPRVVLATDSYWPYVSDRARNCHRLASAMIDQGAMVRVVTPQYRDGPIGLFHDENVPVIRLRHGPNAWWGPIRYWFALADWLRSNRESYDVVCISGLRYDAYAASQALAGFQDRLVLQAVAAGVGGDCDWQETARLGRRVRLTCQEHRVVAATETIAAELVGCGYRSEMISILSNPIITSLERGIEQRNAARAMLRNVHASVRASPLQPVALCASPIHHTELLPPLMALWKRVLKHAPSAQLWMIGQGRPYDVVPRVAERYGLEMSVSAPGMFDCFEELFQAADLLLLPFDTGGCSVVALEAMACGLPVAAVESHGNRQLLNQGEWGAILSADGAQSAGQLGEMLLDPFSMSQTAQLARETVKEKHAPAHVARQHLEFFARVATPETRSTYRAVAI